MPRRLPRRGGAAVLACSVILSTALTLTSVGSASSSGPASSSGIGRAAKTGSPDLQPVSLDTVSHGSADLASGQAPDWAPLGPIGLPASLVPASPGPAPSATASPPAGTVASGTPAPAGQTCIGSMLTGAQADFDGTTGGWIGMDSRLSWVPSPATSPAGSLASVASQNGPMAFDSGRPGAGGLSAAVPGCLYHGGASLMAGDRAVTVTPILTFYDRAGSLLTSVAGQRSEAGPRAWTPLVPVFALAPASAEFVALDVEVSTTAAGETAYLERPVLAAAPDPSAPPVTGPLVARGDRIIQGDGRPLTLRGFFFSGLEASGSPGLSRQSIAEAKGWGANVIRIALGEQLWLRQSCAYDAGYASEVSRVVNWVTSLGMVALLDLQFNDPGDLGASPAFCPAAGQQVMADDPGSIDFWTQVAARFADNPLVAFDLYNEPHDISDQVWLNGGTVPVYDVLSYRAAGMQQLYDAVRSTGASNLVLVSGDNWANTPPSTLVSGVNIAYGVHAYTCPHGPPPDCDSSDPFDPVPILGKWVGLAASVPVEVSEFGWPGVTDGTYDRNVVAFAGARGWGWVAYSWSAAPPWGLIASVAPGGTAEPTPTAMPVLAALSQR